MRDVFVNFIQAEILKQFIGQSFGYCTKSDENSVVKKNVPLWSLNDPKTICPKRIGFKLKVTIYDPKG